MNRGEKIESLRSYLNSDNAKMLDMIVDFACEEIEEALCIQLTRAEAMRMTLRFYRAMCRLCGD